MEASAANVNHPLRIRLEAEELALIDLVRGEDKRSPWIRLALEQVLDRWSGLPPREGLAPSQGTGERRAIPFRLPPDLLARIEQVRGTHARDVWIREAVVRYAATLQVSWGA